MDDEAKKFLETVHSGSMITVRADGSAHVARVTIGMVDGKVWSTGNHDRVRTKHVRANPRATYFIFDTRSRRWLGLEGTVTIHEGPDAPQKCLAFRRAVGTPPQDVDVFLQEMRDTERVVFELEVERSYGGLET